MMDMPAHHPMKAAPGAFMGNRILEVADEVHRPLTLCLRYADSDQ